MRKGFTLIEVLLAMAILAVILAALYGTFFLSERAMSAVDETVLGLHEMRNFMDMAGRETEAAVLNRDNPNTGFDIKDRDIYGKRASRYTFTAFSPLRPGLSLISYYAEEEDKKLVLYKESFPASSNGGNGASGANVSGGKAEVMEDIEGFFVEARSGDKWVGTWDAAETGKLPEEIRITVTVKMKERDLYSYP